MGEFRQGEDEAPFDLESQLRALRSPRRPEFTAALGARVREQVGRAPSRSSLRYGLALALTVAIVASLAALGGLGYAASAGKRAAMAVGDTLAPPKRVRTIARGTSAQAEYKVTICHRTGLRQKPWVQL